MKNKRKWLIYFVNLLIVFFVSTLTIWKIIDQNGKQSLLYLSNLSFIAMVVLIGMFLINYYLEGVIIWLAIKRDNRQIKPTQGFIVQSVGGLFSAITPLKSGYMPSIAYAYSKFGVDAKSFIKTMAKTSFSYQLVCLIISIITIIVCCSKKMIVDIGNVSLNLNVVAIVGLVYNIILMIGYFVLVLSPKLHNWILKILTLFLYKLKKINDKDVYFEEQKEKMKMIRENIKDFLKHYRSFILITAIYLFKVLFSSSLPYVIYLLLTGETFNFSLLAYSIIFSNLISYITNIMPIPGASGAAEVSFVAVFVLIFSNSVLASVMLVWRVFNYFINIIVGFIVFVVLLNVKKKDKTIIQ